MKRIIAYIFVLFGLDRLLLYSRKIFYRGNYVYVLNYHSTPPDEAENFEKQLIFFDRHFSNVSRSDFDKFIHSKTWHKEKPGLILSFDDGHRNNFDVAASVLEKYGFTGWFFVPTAFVDSASEDQLQFAEDHNISNYASYADNRIAMDWDEIRDLEGRDHVIGCHTKSHYRLNASTSVDQAIVEVVESKKVLEDQLGHSMDIFCWVGGEETSYSSLGAETIRRAGYKYSFMTNCHPITARTDRFQLQRNNVETHFSMNMVRLKMSGVMDFVYTAKRMRVNNLTAS